MGAKRTTMDHKLRVPCDGAEQYVIPAPIVCQARRTEQTTQPTRAGPLEIGRIFDFPDNGLNLQFDYSAVHGR